ncbi:MAG: hypothetical protein Q9160_001938 [Pyrenula sp. 1 TL-2023]
MTQSGGSHKCLIIGLSGPSSSGKTTLARLLREIFTIPASPETSNRSISLTIIHEDDFYKTDAEIPLITTPTSNTFRDWDCALALNIPSLQHTLSHITTHARLPPSLTSKEDQNAVGPHGVPETTILALKAEARTWLTALNLPAAADDDDEGGQISLFILDGFLLYPSPSPSSSLPQSIPSLLPLKLFLHSTRAQTLSRRLARTGYVTLEGFWADPPGYVEEVVWPNYVRDCGWVFEGGDVDRGDVSAEAGGVGVRVGPIRGGGDGEGEGGMEEVLGWGAREVREGVERWVARRGGGEVRRSA